MRKSSEVSTRVLKWRLRSDGFLHWIAKTKIFIGVSLIILSFILGKVALPALAIDTLIYPF